MEKITLLKLFVLYRDTSSFEQFYGYLESLYGNKINKKDAKKIYLLLDKEKFQDVIWLKFFNEEECFFGFIQKKNDELLITIQTGYENTNYLNYYFELVGVEQLIDTMFKTYKMKLRREE